MKKCMNCNAVTNNEIMKFCPDCGTRLVDMDRKGTDTPHFIPSPNTSIPGAEISAIVNLRSGKGMTAFSAMNAGKLIVSAEGVIYDNKLGGVSKNHSYTFDQIAQTKFQMTHAGLQPYFGYIVTLKSGVSYTYIYSPIQKNKMQTIDATIQGRMRR